MSTSIDVFAEGDAVPCNLRLHFHSKRLSKMPAVVDSSHDDCDRDDDELDTLAMWGFKQNSCMRCHKTNSELDGYGLFI